MIGWDFTQYCDKAQTRNILWWQKSVTECYNNYIKTWHKIFLMQQFKYLILHNQLRLDKIHVILGFHDMQVILVFSACGMVCHNICLFYLCVLPFMISQFTKQFLSLPFVWVCSCSYALVYGDRPGTAAPPSGRSLFLGCTICWWCSELQCSTRPEPCHENGWSHKPDGREDSVWDFLRLLKLLTLLRLILLRLLRLLRLQR